MQNYINYHVLYLGCLSKRSFFYEVLLHTGSSNKAYYRRVNKSSLNNTAARDWFKRDQGLDREAVPNGMSHLKNISLPAT